VTTGNPTHDTVGFDGDIAKHVGDEVYKNQFNDAGVDIAVLDSAYIRDSLRDNEVRKKKNWGQRCFPFIVDEKKIPTSKEGHMMLMKNIHDVFKNIVDKEEPKRISEAKRQGKKAYATSWTEWSAENDVTDVPENFKYDIPCHFPALNYVITDKSVVNICRATWGSLEEDNLEGPRNLCLYECDDFIKEMFFKDDQHGNYCHHSVVLLGFPPNNHNDGKTITERLRKVLEAAPTIKATEPTDSCVDQDSGFADVPEMFMKNHQRFLESATLDDDQVKLVEKIHDKFLANKEVCDDSHEFWTDYLSYYTEFIRLRNKKRTRQTALDEHGFTGSPARGQPKDDGEDDEGTEGNTNLQRRITLSQNTD
jgi:hypothetical protein